MITSLAKSRLKYNKSRTLLIAIAIALTTTLLMALGTSAVGLLDFNKQQAAGQNNIHANLKNLSAEQLYILKNHVDVESVKANEIFATVDYGKMNGFLTYSSEIKGNIYQGVGNLVEGHYAEKANEICGPKAFFKRMGVEPEIGNKIRISFRPHGEGKIQTKEFVISGIVSERNTSGMQISDSRIAYGANISEKLVKEFLSEDQRVYNAAIRVYGEGSLNYDKITARINDVASDIGCSENDTAINKEYLAVMTDPGTETIKIVSGIALLIIVFSALVIYSIYYVGVITDVQEIGKLKALGASRRQIRRLLMKEGFSIAAVSIPVGLIIGYFIPYLFLPRVMAKGAEASIGLFAEIDKIHMFSLPLLLGVVVVTLLTICISLLKPMRMAAKISPIEAMRYQESSRDGKLRKGNINVNVFNLSKANLTRNKRRTIVTMTTMALSCVLFMSMAGLLNSMEPDDIANREMNGSDFKISLDYALNDKEYPENNLENIQQQDLFSKALLKHISDMDGVEKVRQVHEVPISSAYPSELFAEGNHITIAAVTRGEAEKYDKYGEVKKGKIDYDKLVADGGMIFTSDLFWEDYNLQLGGTMALTAYDGEREVPFDVRLQASVDDGGSAIFVMPEENFERLNIAANSITQIYIDVDDRHYDEVKTALQSLTDSNERFDLYSRDEEEKIGAMSVNIIKYPMYGILLMIAVIGFMNLINTMITSIITRKQELGMLQAIGLSNRQLTKMLAGEGMVFTAGTLIASMTIGNIFGYLVFLWGKHNHFMSISEYHYPVWESLALAVLLVLGQLAITYFIGKRIRRESLIDRIRNVE